MTSAPKNLGAKFTTAIGKENTIHESTEIRMKSQKNKMKKFKGETGKTIPKFVQKKASLKEEMIRRRSKRKSHFVLYLRKAYSWE